MKFNKIDSHSFTYAMHRKLHATNAEVPAEDNPAYGVTLGLMRPAITIPPPTAPQPQQETEYELIPF